MRHCLFNLVTAVAIDIRREKTTSRTFQKMARYRAERCITSSTLLDLRGLNQFGTDFK